MTEAHLNTLIAEWRRLEDVAAVAQGFIANQAVFGTRDPRHYLESVAEILSS